MLNILLLLKTKQLHYKMCSNVLIYIALTLTLGLLPTASYGQRLVYDPWVVTAVNSANSSITGQLITTNTILGATKLYNTVVPYPLSAGVAALAAPDVATTALIMTPAVGIADAIALYQRFTPLEIAACSDGGKGLAPAGTVGVAMMLRCMEVQNLKAFSVTHSAQYLVKLGLIQTELAIIAALPEITAGELASKQAALNAIGQVQTAITAQYNAQRNIINSKMAIAEEIKVAAGDQLTAGRPSNPLTNIQTMAVKTAIGLGITAIANTFATPYR